MNEYNFLYRAEMVNYDESFTEPQLDINYRKFLITKETEHFYFIKLQSKIRRVKKGAIRGFAKQTKEEALKDLKCRNRYYIGVLKTKLIYSQKIKEYLNNY